MVKRQRPVENDEGSAVSKDRKRNMLLLNRSGEERTAVEPDVEDQVPSTKPRASWKGKGTEMNGGLSHPPGRKGNSRGERKRIGRGDMGNRRGMDKRKKGEEDEDEDEDDEEEDEDDQYEGPVNEHSSDEDEHDSQDGSDDEDDSGDDDGSDEIQLDGAVRRESGEDEDEDRDEGEREIVDVSLDFCDPSDRFFHGVRALLSQSYLQDAAGTELSDLVDLAMAQGAVGTVLSTDGEDSDVFGFITALPLRYLARKHACAQAVVKYLLNKAKEAGMGEEMEAIIGEGAKGRAGLFLSERMINCPMQAVPKLHEALVEDIAWAVENEISTEHKEKFRFNWFVMVAPCDSTGAAGTGSHPESLSDFYFDRFDDEVLVQEAKFFFSTRAAAPRGGSAGSGGGGSSSEGSGGKKRYVIGVLKADKYKECIGGIEQMIA